jgi:hypothetical protein
MFIELGNKIIPVMVRILSKIFDFFSVKISVRHLTF